MPTQRSIPALIASLLIAFAAHAHATEPGSSTLEADSQAPAQAYTGAPAVLSFNQLAEPAATPEAPRQPSDHVAARFLLEDTPDDPYSLAWLAISGAAAATLAAHKYRRHTPHWPLCHSPSSTQPALWRDDDCDAQGWRLSRIDELPEQQLAPLYSSLDDTDERVSAKVISLDHARHTRTAPKTFNHTRPIDLDIVDIEHRPISS